MHDFCNASLLMWMLSSLFLMTSVINSEGISSKMQLFDIKQRKILPLFLILKKIFEKGGKIIRIVGFFLFEISMDLLLLGSYNILSWTLVKWNWSWLKYRYSPSQSTLLILSPPLLLDERTKQYVYLFL